MEGNLLQNNQRESWVCCMVCSHNPNGFKWVFSSLSKEFSKSFSETRHVPINIKPDAGVPKTFVDFLEKIKINDDSSASSIVSKISNAFDSFAIQIHDELTVNVFEALKKLSEGIILDKSNNLELDKQTLEEIRESTFILLYRIMFVLYAEDRQIFPNESFYDKNFSLRWIKTNLILKSNHNIAEYSVNKRLRELFRLIEMGSEDLNYDRKEFFMRSYYGRLFDRKIHSNLEKWNIPNKNLLDAIGFLTRTRDKNGNYFFLDYAALETRHLGAIYEHLLEYHLTVKNGKVADLPNPEERKTTGSYYTPKYIVDYIVENSIGPLIDNIVKETDDPSKQIDEILALNILDPAMGSGHFLVGATNYIAKRICEIEYKGDVTEQAFIERKRDVARRCIYGVDLNPLAVDLASVSLWLETLSSEKPLSFLSAHLKSGNSLIGSSIEDVLDTQTTLMETTKGRTSFKKTVRDFIMLEMLEDDTPEAVKTKTVKYNKIQSEGQIYYNLKFMINAKLAQSFDVDVPPIGDYVIKIGENSLDFYSDERWQQVKEIAEEHSFFHWDLEFPDIFYDGDGKRKKNPGFDGVVGNPPYVQLSMDKELDPKLKKYLINRYDSSMGRLNTFGFFISLGIDLLKNNGRLGFIIPNTIMTQDYYEKLREIILTSCNINSIVNFSDLPFKGAVVENIVLTLQKRDSENGQIRNTIAIYGMSDNLNFVQQNQIEQQVFVDSKKKVFGISWNTKLLKFKEKMDSSGLFFVNYLEINQGIALKHNRAKHIVKYSVNDSYKKILDGGEINRYSLTWEGNYLMYNIDEIHSCKREDIFITPEKLLFRRTGNSLIATYDDEKFYALNTLVIMNKKPNVKPNILFFLALFNSKLLNYYCKKFLKSTKKVFSEIQAKQVKNLPVKIPNEDTQEKIVKLVKEIINLKKQLNDTKNKPDVVGTLEREIIIIDNKINNKIYKIYDLTKEEIKLVEDTNRL